MNLHALIPTDMHHWLGSMAKVRTEQAAGKRVTMSDCLREILEREMSRQAKAA
jgi:hypothetical protein